MTTADVDPTAPLTKKRYTAHAFKLDDPFLLGDRTLPSGSPLRISDTPEWPPAILFDFVYADAVLHHFGTQTLKDEVATAWKDIFDPGGSAGGAESNKIMNKEDVATKRTEKQVHERQARSDARSGLNTADMFMALPYIMVPADKRMTVLKEAEEWAEATEQRRVQKKVDNWMKQINTE